VYSSDTGTGTVLQYLSVRDGGDAYPYLYRVLFEQKGFMYKNGVWTMLKQRRSRFSSAAGVRPSHYPPITGEAGCLLNNAKNSEPRRSEPVYQTIVRQ
jgi:hypothetical protein